MVPVTYLLVAACAGAIVTLIAMSALVTGSDADDIAEWYRQQKYRIRQAYIQGYCDCRNGVVDALVEEAMREQEDTT